MLGIFDGHFLIFFNDLHQGVETIKTTENAGTGETIYRCIAANDYLELGLKSGQILKPNRSLNTPPRTIDSINFLNYFEM